MVRPDVRERERDDLSPCVSAVPRLLLKLLECELDMLSVELPPYVSLLLSEPASYSSSSPRQSVVSPSVCELDSVTLATREKLLDELSL